MKKLLLIVFIIYATNVFSQSGWFPQTSGTTNNLWSTSFVDSLTGWAVGATTSNSIVKTTNGGMNWFLQTSPVTNGLNAVKFVNANTGWIVTEAGNVLKTTNGGSFWSTISTGFGSPLYCIYFQDENTGWVAGQIGVILKTINGGTNWTVINAAPSTIFFSGIHFANSLTGYAVGGTLPSTGAVYKTTNGGTNWFSLNIGTITVCEDAYFVNDQTGWVSANAGVIKGTTNGGTNWAQYYVGYASNNNVFDVYFLNSSTGWACGGDYSGSNSSGFIVKTTNGGVNWNSQLNGPMMTSLSFASVNTAYGVGFGGAVYKTITSGETVPMAPTLLSPANNSTNVGLTPTLFWNTVSFATSYKVLVSSMVTFGNVVDSATVSTNQRTIPSGKLNVAATYYWKVLANNQYGSSPWSEAWNFSTVITGITKINSEIPSSFSVSQNFPNPFNPTTNIKFDIPSSTFAKVLIYDVMGREVKILVNEKLSPGTYQTSFDGTILNSGVYFYKLITESYTETKRMLLVK